MGSIRKRIVLAFTSMAVMMAALAMFAYLDMLFLEQRVQQGAMIGNLEYSLMEMRRQEKNLFLYGDQAAGQEAEGLAARADDLLKREHEVFQQLDKPQLLQQLQQSLGDYRHLLREREISGHQDATLEAGIRDQGHLITQAADGLITSMRDALDHTISRSQQVLTLFIPLLAVLVIAVGHVLARRVVTPLKRMADDLTPLAEGRFDRLVIHSQDAEIIAFTEAFNRMLDELDTRRRRLLQSEKLAALGVLVAGVAHEVNNPLSNISSSCQLLLEEFDTAGREQLMAWASIIDSETERARQIVTALMEYGQRREAHPIPVPLAELLRTTQLLLKGPLKRTGGHIEIAVAEGLILYADPQRLQQVFINLLRNATESGEGVTVHVSASPCGEPMPPLPVDTEIVGDPNCHLRNNKQATQIMLEDNGCGIPVEEMPHIFEPFFTRREPGQGMGLGLYIVQEIIQEHDGCIAISSRPPRGTTIYLRMPCMGDAQ